MKKFRFFFLIMTAIVAMSSCSTTRKGIGKGFSTSEQVSIDIADLNAAVDASKRDNFTVSESTELKESDKDGKASTSFTSVKTGSTKTTFTDTTIKRQTTRGIGRFKTRSKFFGKVKNDKVEG